MTQESTDYSPSLRPVAVWLADYCPVMCGELVVLRALPSRTLFCYCTSCGGAFPDLEFSELFTPDSLAPEGIEFPSKDDVESKVGAEGVTATAFEQDLFWDLIAKTQLARGNPSAALAIAEHVIATWYRPPELALELRNRAHNALRGDD